MLRKIKTAYQLPIILMVAYLVFTLILYKIGPLAWVTYHPTFFWSLQIAYILMLFLGWQVGINGGYARKEEWTESQNRRVIKVLPLLLLINLFYEIVNLFRKFLFTSFDVSSLFTKIINGITNMGESYNTFQDGIGTVKGSQIIGGYPMSLFNYLWEFFAFSTVLLATYYFKKLGKSGKCMLIFTYVIILASYISTGTNIGVLRLFLAIVIFFVIKVIRGERSANRIKWKKRKKWVILVSAIAIVFMTVLFDKIMQSRGGILSWNTDSYNIGGIGVDMNSVLFKILPQSLYMLLVSATAYLTQGYYGMSLCLRVNWVPTFGLGHSMAIGKLLNNYVSDVITNRTYQHRIEMFGWDANVQWHSMYSWFANDFSFLGVTIIMFLFGMLFAMAYKDCIKTNNPFAYIMVYYFTLMAFFIPCNNQIFQSTYTMFSFYTMLVLWLCTRGKKRFKWRGQW